MNLIFKTLCLLLVTGNIAMAGTLDYSIENLVIGTAETPEISKPSDKENYISLSFSGKVTLPRTVLRKKIGVETVEKSDATPFIQILGKEFAHKNCDISYCLGYFYFRGSELWIDIQVKDKEPGVEAAPIAKQIGFMDDNGDVQIFEMDGLVIEYSVTTYTWVEKLWGAVDSSQMNISVPAASL